MDFTIPRPSPAKVITSAGGSVLSVTNIMSFASALMFVVTMTISFTMIFPNIDFLKNRINPFYDSLSPFFVNDTGAFQRCSGTDINLCTISSDLADLTNVVNNLSNGTIVAGNFSTNVVIDANTGQTQSVINNNTAILTTTTNATANAALSLAITANTTSNGALSLAGAANTTANGALSLAGAANTTANGALSIALSANTTANAAQTTANNAATAITALQSNVVAEISVRPASLGGNDGTCTAAGGIPCATVTKALTFVNNAMGPFNLWRINIRGYITESAGLALKCGVIYQGDDNSYIQAAGFSYDSNSFGATSDCVIVVRNVIFVPTAASLMDASNYTGQTFFSARYENFSTQGASNHAWTITHGANYAIYDFTDVRSGSGSISSLTIINAHVSSFIYFDPSATFTVRFDAKDGYLNLNNLRIPSGGFFVNNTNSHTLTFEGAGWTNPNSNYIQVNTDSGSSTYVRGSAAFRGCLNFNGTYGPFFVGAGTVFTTLTEGTTGMGHKQLVLIYYNGVTYVSLAEIIESFAKRLYDLENATPASLLSTYISYNPISMGVDVAYPFNYDLTTGTEIISGTNYFTRPGAGSLTYNGSVVHQFKFSYSFALTISYSATSAPYIFISIQSGGTITQGFQTIFFIPINPAGSGANQVITIAGNSVITLTPADTIFIQALDNSPVAVTGLVGRIFTPSGSGHYFSFEQLN